ncbi:MAG: hypothetical protein PHC61_03880 [Chitinivibrionales bacterium]|nr:hypothetical protein [Chitinivibrionales bacterium]
MPIPKIDLTNDQKIWVSEILHSYLKNELPDNAKILLRCYNKLSPGFDYNKIDSRLFFLDELNLLGVYCLDNKNELLIYTDKIITYIKNTLKKQPDLPRIFKAVELKKELKIPIQQIKICLIFITQIPKYCDSAAKPLNEFGYSEIEIKRFDTVQKYLKYSSINSLLEEILFNWQQKSIIPSDKQGVQTQCEICKEWFTAYNPVNIYCSDACKAKSYRATKKT